MSQQKVRVRFAPSPTGGLHLGGMRTVLFNYLFAKKYNGEFILRIEDTDQTRYVEGSEQYIIDCLNWCGLQPDEGPHVGGSYVPYRQSERKHLYKNFAEQLIKDGYAYYAFDTAEELEQMRKDFKTENNPSPQYNHELRMKMKNSLTLSSSEVAALIASAQPYVIRIKMPENEVVKFNDMIREDVEFNTSLVDDKVLLKADGMPTYHLAVVVDDYLMKITHAFRGEEWLPSAPVHILLWKYLGWGQHMPQWAHLPLILKPDGHGKLSKRDGDRLGFPVFAMNWTDPSTQEYTQGFKEKGFLPEAFVNILAMLGWNDGTEQEIFSMEALIQKFSIDRVHKAGARFDYEKAKWFNHEWIKRSNAATLLPHLESILDKKGIVVSKEKLSRIIDLIKDRCTLLPDLYDQSYFFFEAPVTFDIDAIKIKWSEDKQIFFEQLVASYQHQQNWQSALLEENFKHLSGELKIKAGELMLPLRIMLVGGKFGPGIFDIAEIIGKEETIERIQHFLSII